MLFAYLEQVDDSVQVTDRQLGDAIIAAIRPLGYKLHATMDEKQVTALIMGVNRILTDFEQCEKRLRDHTEPMSARRCQSCCMCYQPLSGHPGVDWFTVVVAHRMKRACKACFDREPELQKRWMG